MKPLGVLLPGQPALPRSVTADSEIQGFSAFGKPFQQTTARHRRHRRGQLIHPGLLQWHLQGFGEGIAKDGNAQNARLLRQCPFPVSIALGIRAHWSGSLLTPVGADVGFEGPAAIGIRSVKPGGLNANETAAQLQGRH